MILVDDHCHLTHDQYKKDLNKVLERSKKAGVKAIVCSGVNTPTNREALALAEKHKDIVKCSMGIYPVDALGLGADEIGLARQTEPIDLDAEFDFIRKNKDKIVAIGETGLDYHWVKDEEHQKQMREIFQKVIEFTEKIKKPILIHSRRAEIDVVDMLESSKIKTIIMHCFEARKNLIKKAADKGWYFSIPSTIGKSQQFQTIAQIANINQLLTETDGPWLSPIPGERNEPKNVVLAVKKIAEIKGFTEEETANNIWLNFQKVYL
ncbi:TatD family hydrolase [Candidatus Woesearchaeota archaeon]|nr:TatD family hydrolase [Candidatus Woesearchaeota archaeon]